jgi:hypothetical protein
MRALADATPASVYTPSPRPYPLCLPPLEYPGHYEVRRVSRNGGIRWQKQWVNVSQTLGEQYVALVEIDDGEWDGYFGPLRLGRLHERTLLIEDALGRHYRRPYYRLSPMSSDLTVIHVLDCSTCASGQRLWSPRASEEADRSRERTNEQRWVNGQQVNPDIALTATEPSLVHAGLVHGIEQPEHAGCRRSAAASHSSEPEQEDPDHRCEDRVLDEEGHGAQETIHSRHPYKPSVLITGRRLGREVRSVCPRLSAARAD